MKDARRALAVILVPDYEQEGACSVEAWVLDSIENSLRNSRAQEKRPSTEDTGGGDDGKGIMHGGDDEVRRAIIRAQVIVRSGSKKAKRILLVNVRQKQLFSWAVQVWTLWLYHTSSSIAFMAQSDTIRYVGRGIPAIRVSVCDRDVRRWW